jgi:hypothetical protein
MISEISSKLGLTILTGLSKDFKLSGSSTLPKKLGFIVTNIPNYKFKMIELPSNENTKVACLKALNIIFI